LSSVRPDIIWTVFQIYYIKALLKAKDSGMLPDLEKAIEIRGRG